MKGMPAVIRRLADGRREKTLELAIGEYETGTNIQLWKSYVDNFSVSLIAPEGVAIGPFQENMGSQRYRASGTELLIYYGRTKPIQLGSGDLYGFSACRKLH